MQLTHALVSYKLFYRIYEAGVAWEYEDSPILLSLLSYVKEILLIEYLFSHCALRKTQIHGIVIGSLVLRPSVCVQPIENARIEAWAHKNCCLNLAGRLAPWERNTVLLTLSFPIAICLAPHSPPDVTEFTGFRRRRERERWNRRVMSRKPFPQHLRRGRSRVRCISS